jgi:E3 SUMO-protein ligase PIAS1
MQNILRSTSKSVEQVTIEPDGTWTQHAKQNSPTNMGAGDDDLIEIKETKVSSQKLGNGLSPSLTRTPQMASKGTSAPQTTPNTGTKGKRPISQIIDLTISDGEDDNKPRAPKRQFTTSAYDTPAKMFPGL